MKFEMDTLCDWAILLLGYTLEKNLHMVTWKHRKRQDSFIIIKNLGTFYVLAFQRQKQHKVLHASCLFWEVIPGKQRWGDGEEEKREEGKTIPRMCI